MNENTGNRVPWPLVGAPGICFDINGDWWHEPGSCQFCEGAAINGLLPAASKAQASASVSLVNEVETKKQPLESPSPHGQTASERE